MSSTLGRSTKHDVAMSLRGCLCHAGEASGKLVEVERLEAGALDEMIEPVILLVKQASGDEEVGAAGVNLKGVLLCHGLPHLSHLGELMIFKTTL